LATPIWLFGGCLANPRLLSTPLFFNFFLKKN